MTAKEPPDFYTLQEVSDKLHISLRSVIRFSDTGILPTYKIEGSVRVRIVDYDAWIETYRRVMKEPVEA